MNKLTLVMLALLAYTQIWSQTTVVLEATRDNTLFESNSGSLSNGAGTELFVGTTNNNDRRRALIRFDLSSIPAGAVISAATLTLRMDRTVSGNQNVAVHTVLADWGEGSSDAGGQEGRGANATTNDATWIHRFFNTSNWTSAGGDFTSAASATTSVGGNGNYNWTSTKLAADVQAWLNAPSTNFGWIVIGNESTDRTAKRFASREHGTAANRPKLSVTYTSTVCAAPSITTFAASKTTICAGESSVLSVTGALGGATTWQLYSGSCGGTKLNASANGSFTVNPSVTTSYFVRAEGGCVTPGSCSTLSVMVAVKDDATIAYSQTQYCSADVDPVPTITGKTGGVFTATPAGLSINTATGLIDLAASTSGRTYNVRYITTGTCPDTSTVQLAVVANASAELTYAQAVFCPGDANPSPIITGTSGGTFMGSAGLTINSQTGIITIASSMPGQYHVIYATPGGACQAKDTFQLIIGQNKISELSANICQGDRYQFGDLRLDKAGIYDRTLTTSLGCDSLVVLSLTVTTIDTSVLTNDQGLQATEPAGTGITFTWLDCDRSFAPVPGATARQFLPAAPGHYAVVVQKAGCADTSACFNFRTTAIHPAGYTSLKVYPNPASREIYVGWPVDWEDQAEVILIDLQGKRYQIDGGKTQTIQLPALPPGMYLLQVGRSGKFYHNKLIIRPD